MSKICNATLVVLAISLAGCATPSPPAAPDTFQEVLQRYRPLSCESLAVVERNFSSSAEKAVDVPTKLLWQKYIAAVKQVQIEKKCLTASGKPMLGVRLEPIAPATVRPLGLQSAKGAVIAEVMKGTAAEKAGLVATDIILGIDGRKLATVAEIATAIGQPETGSRIEVLIWRNRRQQVVLVDFGSSVAKPVLAAGNLMEAATADFDAGRYSDAARKYQQVLQQSPQDTLAWYFYGQTMEKLRDVVGAQDAYRRVLSIQPEGQVADYARQALEKWAPKKKAKKK